MNADLTMLMRTAALMRGRALLAMRPRYATEPEAVWTYDGNPSGAVMAGRYCIGQASAFEGTPETDGRLAEHIASWDPAVTSDVAALVECPCEKHALAVARAYLGGDA